MSYISLYKDMTVVSSYQVLDADNFMRFSHTEVAGCSDIRHYFLN